jgi:predicted HicB family RNase H-like nuclease
MAAKKRIGRPPKAKEDRKAVNFTFRSRGQMRERLQAAAIAAGRSISEEIEFRLERSFWQEEIEKDTAKLQVGLPERLRRDLEQAAKHHAQSMNTEIVSRLDSSFQREVQEEMIRRAAQEAVAEAAKLRILPQQPSGKPQLSDEELSHPSADKEEKSK